MAMELAPYKINVNAIAPGCIDTPMTRSLHQPKILDVIPWGRIGQPSEVAKLAVFLASDVSEYLTGTTISIDGGWAAGYKLL
jgi:NAD(P)-dependent dehydrogenase (short-subunit alcohol dehydrogenase family)